MTQTTLADLAQQAIATALKAGATAADAIAMESAELSAGVRHGTPETIERAESRGIGLRVFVGQASANLSSSDLSAASLAQLAEQAVAIARVAPPNPFAALADADRLATATADLDLAEDPALEPTMHALQAAAQRAEEAGRAVAGITNSKGADAGFSRTRIALATSHGFVGEYARTHHSLSATMIAGTGETMQRDYDYALASHATDMLSPEAIGRGAAERAVARMHPRKIASQHAPVFFEPRLARSFLSALASAISGNAIARGTSFLKDALGTPILPPTLTVMDDPLRPRGLSSRPWDAEGVAVTPQAFVAEGVLQGWILDTASARQLGLATTGHAARGLSGTPSPSPSNLYLTGGTLTPHALMQSLGDGLLVTETIGHGVNLVTGDYSLGVSGFWMEHGERAYAVSEITIAGNLREMFASLQAANDLEFRYGTNAPTLAFPRLTIAGN